MTQRDDPEALVTIAQARTEFEANVIVAVLADAGIEAVAFAGAFPVLPVQSKFLRVLVQVQAADAEQAARVLQTQRELAAETDWDQVDLGQREDDLPLTQAGRTPPLGRVGWYVAVVLLAAAALGALYIALA